MEQVAENAAKSSPAIFIIGNGVIAKALAVALTLKEKKVTIIRGSIDEESDYQENIQVEVEGNSLQAEVTISTFSNQETLEGIILLTSKSFGNEVLRV